MAGSSSYDMKADSYFEGARSDFVNELPENPAAQILEIGCSNGNTGALALGINAVNMSASRFTGKPHSRLKKRSARSW